LEKYLKRPADISTGSGLNQKTGVVNNFPGYVTGSEFRGLASKKIGSEKKYGLMYRSFLYS